MAVKNEIVTDVSQAKTEPDTEPNQGKPYDDVFHTLLVDCPELVIPLINEAFGEHYDRKEKVDVYHDVFFIVGQDKRETDSHIGIRQRKYHVECQSYADGTLLIRLFEYDAQIAIEDAEQKRNEVIFTFPHTTVLYLRCNKNTPSRMKVTIKVPGDSAGYEIPIMKVPEYTLDEIMEKELYFLLPFHLFQYEKKLGLYENDEEQLEELKEIYRQIMRYLDRKLAEGNLTAFQCWVIQETTRKVAENLAVKYEKVREGVEEVMGGQVLELECVKQWNARLEEGKISVLNDLVKDGILTLSEAAKRASMTEEDYAEQIKRLGL